MNNEGYLHLLLLIHVAGYMTLCCHHVPPAPSYCKISKYLQICPILQDDHWQPHTCMTLRLSKNTFLSKSLGRSPKILNSADSFKGYHGKNNLTFKATFNVEFCVYSKTHLPTDYYLTCPTSCKLCYVLCIFLNSARLMSLYFSQLCPAHVPVFF